MSLPGKNVFNPAFAIAEKDGKASQLFRDYMTKLDFLISAMAAGNLPTLVSAIDDAAAAVAGVPLGGLYRSPTTGIAPNTVSTLRVRVS